MISVLLHLLHTLPTDAALSRIYAAAGVYITFVVWRRSVRRITRILSTTAILGASALLFCHPLDLSHFQPEGPPTAQFGQYQP